MKTLLPRHLEIILRNQQPFLREVSYKYPGDVDRLRDMSLIEEGAEHQVRMAYLAIVGSHSVNGVSELHTKLLCKRSGQEFLRDVAGKIQQQDKRHYASGAGCTMQTSSLRPLISEQTSATAGSQIFSELKKLAPFADDPDFRKKWREAKSPQ